MGESSRLAKTRHRRLKIYISYFFYLKLDSTLTTIALSSTSMVFPYTFLSCNAMQSIQLNPPFVVLPAQFQRNMHACTCNYAIGSSVLFSPVKRRFSYAQAQLTPN